jgi:serine/threonine-protein kinase
MPPEMPFAPMRSVHPPSDAIANASASRPASPRARDTAEKVAERSLNVEARGRGTLPGVAGIALVSPSSMETSPAPMLSVSAGRYRVYDALASGGMATLHYGRMLGSDGAFARTVAIKRLRPELAADPELVAMLLDEARLASRIRHPNVVPVLDVLHNDSEVLLVLEYVHGESLATLLRRARELGASPEPRVLVAVIVAILHGLHAAHEATDERGDPLGIVHRDVSPQNILVGADGTARVVDFGIAKAAGRIQATRDGQLKGKLAYMAPEQLTNGDVTRQADVYAAAVCCWEGLTGARLFPSDSEGGVLAAVLNATVQPPSARSPGVPAALDPVVMRGMDRAPSRRFATAREMALHLEACLLPATQSEVAAWVDQCASEELARRSARIAEIERGAVSSVPLVPRSADAETQVDAPPERAPGRRVSRAVPLLASVLAVSAVVALGARSWRAAPSVTAPVAADTPTAAPASPAVSVAPSAPVVSSPAAAVAPPAPAPARASSATTHAHAKNARACDPAYVIDDQGHKIYKAECFR